MMRDQIVAAARSWIGTPFHHQQCVKGHGVDCIQFVAAVGHEAGLCDRVPVSRSNYSRRPNPRNLIAGMREHLIEIHKADAFAGDILLIAWRNNLPMHLAIITGNDSMVHASEAAGSVIEQRIEDNVIIHSFWRFGALNDG